MKKLLIGSAVAASLLASSAMARIASDGTGQYLVAPAYYATSGYKTELRLVNTDFANSVIMRGVIREFQSSEESDFIIMLSPGDVWSATIETASDGKVTLSSTDDSNYNSAINGAKLTDNLFKYTAAAVGSGLELNRTYSHGYVEFYPIASINTDPASLATVGGIQVAPVIAKSAIQKVFDTHIDVGSPITPVDLATAGITLTAPFNTAANAGLAKVGPDQVAGYVTMTNDTLKAAMTLPMVAFEDDSTGLIQAVSVPYNTSINTGDAPGILNAGVSPGKRAMPGYYLGTVSATDGVAHVLRDLYPTSLAGVSQVTAPFENSGTYDALYFAFLFDGNGGLINAGTPRYIQAADNDDGQQCVQARSFMPHARDMSETRNALGTNVISPATDPINMVKCELGVVSAGTVLSATNSTAFTEGAIKLTNFIGISTPSPITGVNYRTREGTGFQAAFVPSQIKAKQVNGSYSYSWINVAGDRIQR